MIHRVRRLLLVVVVSATLSLTCALPALAQTEEQPRSLWTALGDWLSELSRTIGTWAGSDGESVPLLDPNGMTESPPPAPMSNGAEDGPDADSDAAPFIDPDG